jgi:hyperpolarization activated cyclic nucleotide-gated potassium channel 2
MLEEKDCWLRNSSLEDSEVSDQYIASLYWAFETMTTVGYGDIYPITNIEKIFTMFSMLVSCGVFAYVVGSIETIVKRSNTIEYIFKERILHVNQYLIHQNIPKYLRISVRRYLEQMQAHRKKEKLSQNEVLSMLNKNLQDEVLIQIVGGILRQKKIFVELFDDRLFSEVIFMLEQKMFLMDDHIFEEGDNDDKFNEDMDIFEGHYIENDN